METCSVSACRCLSLPCIELVGKATETGDVRTERRVHGSPIKRTPYLNLITPSFCSFFRPLSVRNNTHFKVLTVKDGVPSVTKRCAQGRLNPLRRTRQSPRASNFWGGNSWRRSKVLGLLNFTKLTKKKICYRYYFML